jgi:hypothetical protein
MQLTRQHRYMRSTLVVLRLSLALLFFVIAVPPIAAQELNGSYQGQMITSKNPFIFSFNVKGRSISGTFKRTQEYVVKSSNWHNVENTTGEIRGTVDQSGKINATLRGTVESNAKSNNIPVRQKSTFTGTMSGQIQGKKASGSWSTTDTEDAQESSSGNWQASAQ